MTKVNLEVKIEPSAAIVSVAIRTTDSWQVVSAVVDTGAEMSLFDVSLLHEIEYQLLDTVVVEQAGIANQAVTLIEAEIQALVFDMAGNYSRLMTMKAWFTNTAQHLLGFEGILDASRLVIDMPKREAYLDVPPPAAD